MAASVTTLRTETVRTSIDRVDETTTDDRAEVVVTLHWDGADHAGSAAGLPSARLRPLLVAQATLAALRQAGLRDFEALEVSTTQAAGQTVAVVAVEDPLLTQPLVGTAVASEDALQMAFARATLDAVNRRLDA